MPSTTYDLVVSFLTVTRNEEYCKTAPPGQLRHHYVQFLINLGSQLVGNEGTCHVQIRMSPKEQGPFCMVITIPTLQLAPPWPESGMKQTNSTHRADVSMCR